MSEQTDSSINTDNTRSGAISEGELELALSLAKQIGWVPEEEWDRSTPHQGPVEYLRGTVEDNKKLRTRVKEVTRGLDVAMEHARKIALADAEIRVRQAAQANDGEAAVRAAQEMARQADMPLIQAWVERNQWFNSDPHAAKLAVDITNQLEGHPVAYQLEQAEAVIRKRFPEYFPDLAEAKTPKAEPQEVEVERARPQVQPGTRQNTYTSQRKERGWAEMPKDVRGAMNDSIDSMKVTFGNRVDVEKQRAEMAKDYWKLQDE